MCVCVVSLLVPCVESLGVEASQLGVQLRELEATKLRETKFYNTVQSELMALEGDISDLETQINADEKMHVDDLLQGEDLNVYHTELSRIRDMNLDLSNRKSSLDSEIWKFGRTKIDLLKEIDSTKFAIVTCEKQKEQFVLEKNEFEIFQKNSNDQISLNTQNKIKIESEIKMTDLPKTLLQEDLVIRAISETEENVLRLQNSLDTQLHNKECFLNEINKNKIKIQTIETQKHVLSNKKTQLQAKVCQLTKLVTQLQNEQKKIDESIELETVKHEKIVSELEICESNLTKKLHQYSQKSVENEYLRRKISQIKDTIESIVHPNIPSNLNMLKIQCEEITKKNEEISIQIAQISGELDFLHQNGLLTNGVLSPVLVDCPNAAVINEWLTNLQQNAAISVDNIVIQLIRKISQLLEDIHLLQTQKESLTKKCEEMKQYKQELIKQKSDNQILLTHKISLRNKLVIQMGLNQANTHLVLKNLPLEHTLLQELIEAFTIEQKLHIHTVELPNECCIESAKLVINQFINLKQLLLSKQLAHENTTIVSLLKNTDGITNVVTNENTVIAHSGTQTRLVIQYK